MSVLIGIKLGDVAVLATDSRVVGNAGNITSDAEQKIFEVAPGTFYGWSGYGFLARPQAQIARELGKTADMTNLRSFADQLDKASQPRVEQLLLTLAEMRHINRAYGAALSGTEPFHAYVLCGVSDGCPGFLSREFWNVNGRVEYRETYSFKEPVFSMYATRGELLVDLAMSPGRWLNGPIPVAEMFVEHLRTHVPLVGGPTQLAVVDASGGRWVHRPCAVEASAATEMCHAAIAAGVTLNASQVNAGTFNGLQLVLNLSGVTTTIDNHAFGGDQVGLEAKKNSTGDGVVVAPTFMSLFNTDPVNLKPAASVARNGSAGIVKVYDGSGSGQVDGHGLRCAMDGSNGNISANGSIQAVGGAAFVAVYNSSSIVGSSLAMNGGAGIVKAFDGTGSGSLGSGLRCVMDGSNGRITSTDGLWDANGNRVVNTRYPAIPTTLADVIAVLRWHGLSA
jgi:hypothetical protein